MIKKQTEWSKLEEIKLQLLYWASQDIWITPISKMIISSELNFILNWLFELLCLDFQVCGRLV